MSGTTQRRRPSARRTLITGSAGLALIAVTAGAGIPVRIVWNASASVPVGLYAIASVDRLAVRQIVLVHPPAPLAAFLAARGYVGAGVPLLKRVAALPGQTVCRHGSAVSVDGVTQAVAHARDRLGRPLPRWKGCRALGHDEVFLLNRQEPASLDGRYFGPILRAAVVGRATPLWARQVP